MAKEWVEMTETRRGRDDDAPAGKEGVATYEAGERYQLGASLAAAFCDRVDPPAAKRVSGPKKEGPAGKAGAPETKLEDGPPENKAAAPRKTKRRKAKGAKE